MTTPPYTLTETLEMTTNLTQAAQTTSPDAVAEKLGAARLGLTVAGTVAELLAAAPSSADTLLAAHDVAAEMAWAACNHLDAALNQRTTLEHGPAFAHPDGLYRTGQIELQLATDASLARLAVAMVGLAATIESLLDRVTGHPRADTTTGRATTVARLAARLIQAHYGSGR